MWNCKFVWHVVVSTWTKFPTCGSLPLPFVPFTHLLAYPLFSYQLSACSLGIEIYSYPAKVKFLASAYSHNCISTHSGPLPLKIKMDYDALMTFSDWEGIFNCIGIPGAVHWKESWWSENSPKWTWFSEGRKYINSPLLWVYNEAALFLHHPVLSVKESMREKSHW